MNVAVAVKERKYQSQLMFFAMALCKRPMVVRVDIGVVIYEAMTPLCGRSVVQVLVVRVDIGVVTYETMTLQCGRSVVLVLVVRVSGFRSGYI